MWSATHGPITTTAYDLTAQLAQQPCSTCKHLHCPDSTTSVLTSLLPAAPAMQLEERDRQLASVREAKLQDAASAQVERQQLAGELSSTSRRLAALEAAADSDVRQLQEELRRLDGQLHAAHQETITARWGPRCLSAAHQLLCILCLHLLCWCHTRALLWRGGSHAVPAAALPPDSAAA